MRVAASQAVNRLAVLARRAELPAAVVLAVIYFALRTTGAHRHWLELWYVVSGVFAVAFPAGGLLLVIPVGMFIGPFFLRQSLPVWTVWTVVWVAGVYLRVGIALVRERAEVVRVYRNPALIAGLALLAASALSVVTMWRHYGRAIGMDSLERWLWGPGTAFLVLIAAAWVLRDGRLRPVAVALGTGVAAALLSLAAWFAPASIRASALAWTLGPADTSRLHGVTYLAPGLEAMLIVPAAMLVMVALYGGGRRTRVAAVLALVPVVLAIWFTFNRAGLMGAYVIVVVAAWQARPRLGKVMAGLGLAGGLAVLPFYLSLRGSMIGAPATAAAGQTLSPSDQIRVEAWGAAIRMWQDAPLLGHGFRSFFRLHEKYGSVALNAPHNDWLRLFAEGGIIAGLAGLAFVAAVAWYLSRGHGWLPRAALAAFGCWVLALCFNNILSYEQASIPLMVIIAAAVTAVRRERAAASPAPSAAAPPVLPAG